MPKKLVNMKISQAARDKMNQPSSIATDQPAYPWGLSISLDNDSLRKLDLDGGDLTVGSTLSLRAKVEVVSISSNESKGGDSNQNVSLQITDLGLDGEGDAAKELYK